MLKRLNKEQLVKRETRYKKYIKRLWILTGLAVIAIPLTFFILSFSNLPSTEQLENPRSQLATQVFAADGEVLGRYYIENRVPVEYDDLSPYLVNALIATEDERFHKHSGVDFRGLMRAISGLGSKGGGSTITQQLAKLLFTNRSSNIVKRMMQKLKEWIIAVRLERKYTKEEIMAMYFNKFDFLYESDGIKAASENYFGKDQKDLKIEEAAMLVGMFKNPSLYNPKRRPEAALARRNTVLGQMLRNNLIEKVDYDSLKLLPLDMSNFKRKTHNDGLAPHFRSELGKELKRILRQKNNLKSDGTKYDIYRDGLKIYTTIDPAIQAHAEEQMRKHMAKLQKKFEQHWKKKDPWTYRHPEKTTDREMELREQKMQSYIRRSDRYQAMRSRFLNKPIKALEAKVEGLNIRPSDVDIDRMMAEDKEPGSLGKMRKRGLFGRKLATTYFDALKTEEWKDLRNAWNALQRAVDEAFEKPAKMVVFTYENEAMEKDTVLSPLDSIKYHSMFLQLGSMSVDPKTGAVKSWVGGINHKYFQYDHVTSARQVGSTFKPFVYTTAIAMQGFSPCYQVYDQAYTIMPGEGNFTVLKEWTPKNSNDKYTGELLTLLDGLKRSKNTVSVHLMKQLRSVEPVRGLVHNMGIDSSRKYSNGRYYVPKVPSICLGAADLTVQEMTGAYSTFANNGTYIKPYFIQRIEDKTGTIIYDAEQDLVERQAVKPQANYVMVEMLRYSGRAALWELKSDVGGKTGTTNSHVDGWFMGITPNLVVGTWVGGEDRWMRFRTLDFGSGSYMAKPYFRELMKSLEKDEEIGLDVKKRFYRPPGDLGIELDCGLYNPSSEEEEEEEGDDGWKEDQFGDEMNFGTDSTTVDDGFQDDGDF